jgi:hypothetical protein
MANNPLETFGSEIVAGLLGSVNLRDYQDAARTFLPGNYARIPKSKSWFHVYFELNQGVAANIRGSLGNLNGGPNARFNWFKQAGDEEVFGILVKNVRLPSFKFDIKAHNQYNRKNLVMNKINYEPIDIEFHDDMSNIVRDFWYGYYQYYNQDPRYAHKSGYSGNNQGVKVPEEWSQSQNSASTAFSSVYSSGMAPNWGLDTVGYTSNGSTPPQGLAREVNLLKAIRIYHFSRSRTRPPAGMAKGVTNNAHFAEYVLVNPLITSFSHDTLDYSENSVTANTMSIDYETVLYNAGVLGANEIASWQEVQRRFFDITPSPLGTNVTTTIFGIGGIADSVANIFAEIAAGNFAGAAVLAARLGVNAQDIKAIALGDINESVRNALAAIASGKGSGFPAP